MTGQAIPDLHDERAARADQFDVPHQRQKRRRRTVQHRWHGDRLRRAGGGLFQAVASYSGLPAPSDSPQQVALTLSGGGASAEAMWGPPGGLLWVAHDPSKNIGKLKGVAVYAAASGGGQGAVDRLPVGSGNNFAGGLIEGIVAFQHQDIRRRGDGRRAAHHLGRPTRGLPHAGPGRVGDAGIVEYHRRARTWSRSTSSRTAVVGDSSRPLRRNPPPRLPP